MLRFKRKSRVSHLGKRKGQTLHFAQQQPNPRMTLAMVEDKIAQSTALSKGDVRSAIRALADVVNEALLMGMSVDLGDLGGLKVVAGSACVDTAAEVTARTIRKPRIRYYPKREMEGKAMAVAISVESDETSGATCPTPPQTGGGGSPQTPAPGGGKPTSSEDEDGF